MIAEVEEVTGEVHTHVWGVDLSGTTHGAGGVGGLVATVIHNGPNAGVYFAVYDGNGNVMGYVRASDGVMVAQYEYGPFGELLRATVSLAKDFYHLFSTKYFDWETGLSCYGHRYYSPTAGRWPSRDPIGERGGINLYGFVGNNPISRIDPLGLDYYGGGNADFREKFACWWDCGAEKSKKAAALAGQALSETQKRFPGMLLHNDKADAWRHCFWSCEMARAIGQQCAKDIGDNHENAGDRKGQPKNEREMDEHNNAAGRGFASQTGIVPTFAKRRLMTAN